MPKKLTESIYDLIPPAPERRIKRLKYKSKYPSKLSPSCSTFTTGQVSSANHGGLYEAAESRSAKLPSSSFGPHKLPATSKQLKTKKVKYKKGLLKPPLPSMFPVHGLETEKNFVIANAINNMLSEPKKRQVEKSSHSWKHENFGKIPEYLVEIKEQVEEEDRQIQRLSRESLKNEQKEIVTRGNHSFTILPDAQRQNMLRTLKEKHTTVMHGYQKLTHKSVLSCISEQLNKENFEKQLEQLETDIKLLSKETVIIQKEKS